MADRGRRESQVLFCHNCRGERIRNGNELECPECQSEFVEVIDRSTSDLQDHYPDDDDSESSPERTPDPRPTSPWIRETFNTNERNIQHFEWEAGPGLRFFQTSVRTSSPGMGSPGQHMNDPFAPFLQSFSTIMEGTASAQRQPPFSPPGGTRRRGSDLQMPRFHNHFPTHGPWSPPSPGSIPGSPLREGSPGFSGSRHTYTARLRPRDANNAQRTTAPVDHLQAILGNLLQSINGMDQNSPSGPNPGGPNSPFHLFAQLLNPANAAHGDAVYTEEALDRVITQFMEQANGSSAPGPASAEAINRLPKKAADKSMMGNDGKAECSVCMDSVNIGDEVTVLPCSHWFHGDCVGAWLKEHDTCPHCRQGIMPKDSSNTQTNTPRTAGVSPRREESSSRDRGIDSGSDDRLAARPWQQGSQRIIQEQHNRPSDHHHHHHHHRRRSSAREARNGGEGSSGGGSWSGWVRDRLGRGNSDRT